MFDQSPSDYLEPIPRAGVPGSRRTRSSPLSLSTCSDALFLFELLCQTSYFPNASFQFSLNLHQISSKFAIFPIDFLAVFPKFAPNFTQFLQNFFNFSQKKLWNIYQNSKIFGIPLPLYQQKIYLGVNKNTLCYVSLPLVLFWYGSQKIRAQILQKNIKISASSSL